MIRVSALPPLPLAAAACALVAGGCSDSPETGLPSELPLLTVGEPTLEIGVVDGADEYLFGAIASVVSLSDGSIAVSDAGSSRITVYDHDGVFQRRWGQRGDGPAEFQNLSRLYPLGTDSLLAANGFVARVSVFHVDGTFGRALPAVELTGDPVFSLDSWLHGRFWVDGPLTEEERAPVRAVLDALPSPRSAPGYRSVQVDADGRFWIREPGSGTDVTWTRLRNDGRPEAVVTLPGRFRPTWASGDELLGVWLGEADVHFARRYPIVATGRSWPMPAWLTGSESAVTTDAVPDDEELMALIRGSIKQMASRQEIHYSEHYSYTTEVDALEGFEKPEGLEVHFTVGNTRGWAAVFSHAAVDRLCGLAYGSDVPPGWTPGMVLCGPPHADARGEEG